ncbi:uncharacterized protein Dvir_GJ26397 [Drosophila virilis]|uniref:Uncharacterized protein n=1 Tax=Drosophila virilis TaxID=7244 RepID=A0A0Q9WJ84_DROVI|nr:uncharacterized protein Dvir_GJ26397 [Drosophila virilis]
MTNSKYLVFIIHLIGLWTLLCAKDESMVKSDGRTVYKYIDKRGMEWEYEHMTEKVPGQVKADDVIVYNGVWTPNKRSHARNFKSSTLLIFVLVRLII